MYCRSRIFSLQIQPFETESIIALLAEFFNRIFRKNSISFQRYNDVCEGSGIRRTLQTVQRGKRKIVCFFPGYVV